MEKGGKEVSLFVEEKILSASPHSALSCIACHTGFDPENIPHKDPITPVNCKTCHTDATRKHAFHPQMIRASGTDGTKDISCKSCHGTHDVVSRKVAGSVFHPANISQTCKQCHAETYHTYSASAHATAAHQGIPGSPTCLTCHRNDITAERPGRTRQALKVAQEKMCLSCHLDDPNVRARTSPSAGFIAAYEKSVHGRALLGGHAEAANCVDCHGSHEVAKGTDPLSKVHRHQISATCGTCHEDIAGEFNAGVHGQAVLKGVKDAPVCTDCHGEHNILSPTDPRSPVAPLNVSGQVCSPCHTSVALTEKYGISANRFQTFSDSYHGLAVRAGSVEAANCASCHGSHKILRSSDPASPVHKDNLAQTCGGCHPGANERFAIGKVHVSIARDEEPALYWISTAYIFLIVSIVGGMFIHNTADFIKKARRRMRIRRGEIPEHTGRGLYLRMTVSERLQHGSLLVSFILLVITGFMLRYPEAWWVVAIRSLSDSVFDLRGLVHRIAAVVMVSASLYHIGYLTLTERGRALFRDLLPRLQDVRDAVAVLKYNFGFSRVKPRFGRFSYIEKSEYWALVWGTIVMALTGVIMWFDNTFMGLLTKLGWDIARTIHFYEAWLATLSIIVWHFYYVIFNPDVYPMSMAWLTGHLTEGEMAEEHPLELEKRKEEGMEEVKTKEVKSDEGER
ncbi:MAG: cytochrome b/b6 domain-containing protein [Ignavibacteriales bacterium]|nr:cytochrome b/b6 domain-containing protein [Ignavibacteriales bacterium]